MVHMRIRDLREDSDLTQQQLADYLHIAQGTYSRYEKELSEIPASSLVRLARLYNTSVDYLLGLTNIRRPYPRKRRSL